MSDILATAILATPIILTAWHFLRNDAEARIYITGIGMLFWRCPEARIYVTEIGTFLTLMLGYTYFAFSLGNPRVVELAASAGDLVNRNSRHQPVAGHGETCRAPAEGHTRATR